MNSRDFAYWLQGLFELADPKTLDEKQTLLIKKHLHMVFAHEIDPSFGEDLERLQEIHEGTEVPGPSKGPTPRPVRRPGVPTPGATSPSDPFSRRITC